MEKNKIFSKLNIKNYNNELNKNFEGVCQYIDIAVKESLRQPAPDTSL